MITILELGKSRLLSTQSTQDDLTFNTQTGKANFRFHKYRACLRKKMNMDMTIRSMTNTIQLSIQEDRYRGIKSGRKIVMMNQLMLNKVIFVLGI